MQRSVWNDIVSWQTRRLSNSKKYPLHASMTTTSEKKKWNLLANCHKHALNLFKNVYTWQELDDLIFCGQWINLHDRLRTQNKGRNINSTVAIKLVWKMVGPPGRRENSLWKAIRRTIQRLRHSVWRNGWVSSDFFKRPAKAPPVW